MADKFALNLDHFKKIRGDNQSTTLKHIKDNHEIKIAHKALSAQQKEKLSKLEMHAEGGTVGDDSYFDPEAFKSSYAPPKEEEILPKEGEASPKEMPGPESPESIKTPEFTMPTLGEASPSAMPGPQSLNGPKVADLGNEISGNILAGGQAGPADMQLPPSQNANPLGDYGQQQLGGLALQSAGLQKQALAQSELGAGQEQAQKEHEAALQEKANTYEEANNNLIQERTKMQNEIADGHIDPQKFINNMSTGSRIGTALGLILGGMGAGLTHGPNLAYNFLQKQIDEDIDAQKADMGKKENLLRHNYEQTRDLRQAYDMTRLQMNDMLASHLSQLAGKATNEIGKAQAMQTQGMMMGKSGELQHALALQQMQMGGASGQGFGQADPAKLVPLLVPKEHQAKVFGEIEAAENTRHMGQSIMKSFEDAANENTVLRTGAGMVRTPGSVLSLHQSMQPTFKDLEGTVRQAAMENTFKNITPSPGDSEHTINQKRESLKEYLKSKMSAPIARGYGIDLSRFQGTKPYQPANKQLPGQAYEERIINGKKYRVPKGQ